MDSKKIPIILALLTGLAPMTLFALNPPNLYQVKQELIHYHDSGQYNNSINQVTNSAIRYLQDRVKENQPLKNPKKLAVVFDIDETSLSNYPEMLTMGFGGTPAQIDAQEALGIDPAIVGTLQLYHFAKQNKVAVFFITGRTGQYRQIIMRNLINAGYSDWNGLYLKPQNYHQASVVPYKSGVRKQIQSQGYDIVLDVGDQWSDLNGGYADKTFKLPNPFYYIS